MKNALRDQLAAIESVHVAAVSAERAPCFEDRNADGSNVEPTRPLLRPTRNSLNCCGGWRKASETL